MRHSRNLDTSLTVALILGFVAWIVHSMRQDRDGFAALITSTLDKLVEATHQVQVPPPVDPGPPSPGFVSVWDDGEVADPFDGVVPLRENAAWLPSAFEVPTNGA